MQERDDTITILRTLREDREDPTHPSRECADIELCIQEIFG